MENSELPAANRWKHRLEDYITNAKSLIEEEYSHADGEGSATWLDCFATVFYRTKGCVEFCRELVSSDKNNELLEEIGRIRQRLAELRRQYPRKKDIPPPEIQEELLASLERLRI